MRTAGTTAIGIRTPIIKKGDDLAGLVVQSIKEYCEESNTSLNDRDVIGITEAVVARAQGNYATCEQIAEDVRKKFPGGEVGIVFPILSRNRFSMILKSISMGVDKVYIQLSYPSDEVGNHLVDLDALDDAGLDPYTDVLTEEEFRKIFGDVKHTFTQIDYMELYRTLANNATIILANNPTEILKYTKHVIAADIHTRHRTKRRLKAAGAETVLGIDDLLNESVNGSGFNKEYGLLGSNKATNDQIKLFPHSCDLFVKDVQDRVFAEFGKKVEVLVYGDGAFKDPVGKIWELADPVVSPAYTDGLIGLPNELKLKYIADNELGGMDPEEAKKALIERIKNKTNLMGKEVAEGTTPRNLTDLIGSLCDLVSGSGDKGTPVILIKGYFDNYASQD